MWVDFATYHAGASLNTPERRAVATRYRLHVLISFHAAQETRNHSQHQRDSLRRRVCVENRIHLSYTHVVNLENCPYHCSKPFGLSIPAEQS